MSGISMVWADANLKTYGDRIQQLNTRFPKVLPRIVNQVGNRSKTQVIRALTAQTGLLRRTIVKAVGDPGTARPGKLSYDLVTRGGNIRLKYLNPRDTEAGVVAKPFGKTTLYPGAFMKGGRFPDRKEVPAFNGHAMVRVGRTLGVKGGSRHYTFARSGVMIPYEMTRAATRAAFLRTAAPLLKERVDAVIVKLLP